MTSIHITHRPIERWPGELMAWAQRRPSPFKVNYSDTLDLLDRELWQLSAKQVVLQLALSESDIRNDGLPRAAARPAHPGVVVAFGSRHGPMEYATDVFTTWQDNLRAIALGLEALRKVERYGITKSGNQYRGWAQLPAGHSQTQMDASDIAIPLRNATGAVVAEAIVDVEDADLAALSWYQLAAGYVVRTEVIDGVKRTIYLHRAVLGLRTRDDDPVVVDHIDGNKLDNRRRNLRMGTARLNNQNRDANRANPWPRGVRFKAMDGVWEANVKLDGHMHYLGRFGTPAGAGQAAAAFRAEHMPWSKDAREFTKLRAFTVEQATAFLAVHSQGLFTTEDLMVEVLTPNDKACTHGAYRAAAKHMHPDRGGDPQQWHQLVAAYELLAGAS